MMTLDDDDDTVKACTKFARPRNMLWMNAHTSLANVGHTKVGTTMSRHQCLRGLAEKVSGQDGRTIHRATRRDNVDIVRCCWSRQTRVGLESATLMT
jgi:hypothetical protein